MTKSSGPNNAVHDSRLKKLIDSQQVFFCRYIYIKYRAVGQRILRFFFFSVERKAVGFWVGLFIGRIFLAEVCRRMVHGVNDAVW